ncbi:hypothetical protein [Bradyrhizobium sp. SZCCHNS3002]|uniref:hypothetical protein n=1 Tax=Bradyrhizobium sp. SZCCHNS3002 TaxID=3057310 RepID=UPI0028EDA7FD|nr:hypothetical protein [Bradyrhizobium sp. SZCCHNS3002]
MEFKQDFDFRSPREQLDHEKRRFANIAYAQPQQAVARYSAPCCRAAVGARDGPGNGAIAAGDAPRTQYRRSAYSFRLLLHGRYVRLALTAALAAPAAIGRIDINYLATSSQPQ